MYNEYLKRKNRPMLRYPHTQQERRMSFAAPCYPENVPHSEIRGRARRNACQLPTSYEDIFINYQKCWKLFRKTKYKRIKRK
jgi:hypothetical protein